MKKSLIALAVAGVFAAPVAMAETTVYGQANVSYDSRLTMVTIMALIVFPKQRGLRALITHQQEPCRAMHRASVSRVPRIWVTA